VIKFAAVLLRTLEAPCSDFCTKISHPKSFSGFPQFTQVKPCVVLNFRFLSHIFFFQSIIYQHQTVRTVQLSLLDREEGSITRLSNVDNCFPVDIA